MLCDEHVRKDRFMIEEEHTSQVLFHDDSLLGLQSTCGPNEDGNDARM